MKILTRSLRMLFVCCLLSAFIFTNPEITAGSSPSSSDKALAPKKTATAIAGPPLPDLIVERIWLDTQCKINFKLKNNGPGDIPNDKYRATKVRLFIGSQKMDFSLSQPFEGRPAVDPSGSLKHAGGSASFNTAQSLELAIL